MDEMEDITTEQADIKKTREYYEQLYTNKFDSLDEINQFLEKHKPAILY